MASSPQMKSALPVIRSKVDENLRCQDYRDDLRIDFYFSCGYCSITEIEAAGLSFQIDHYLPIEKYSDKEDDYLNLIYSCQKCNRNKSDFFPGKDGFPDTYHIIRPDEEDPREHYDLENNELKGITDLGKFNIQYLNLNRKALQTIRSLRERLWQSQKYIAFGVTELRNIKIDNLPEQFKKAVFKFKIELSEQQKESIDTIEKFIEVISRSHIIDTDPENETNLQNRKKYLKELKAITKY